MGDVREKGSGPFFWRNFPWELTFHGENVGALSGVGVLIPTQDYKSLRAKNYHLTCPGMCYVDILASAFAYLRPRLQELVR